MRGLRARDWLAKAEWLLRGFVQAGFPSELAECELDLFSRVIHSHLSERGRYALRCGQEPDERLPTAVHRALRAMEDRVRCDLEPRQHRRRT